MTLMSFTEAGEGTFDLVRPDDRGGDTRAGPWRAPADSVAGIRPGDWRAAAEKGRPHEPCSPT